MPLRFDTYKVTRKAIKQDTTGFLKVPVFATRTGIFSYRTPSGQVRRELRHPDEVFKADSLQTLAGVPFTNRHPSELVNSKNVRKYMVGAVSDNVGRHDDDQVSFVDTSVTIMDEKMIDQVEKHGIREVSCGYKCDVVDEPGEYNGERYDARQTNIRYNHLAGVDKGRAGSQVRLRMDSDDGELVEDDKSGPNHNDNPKGGIKMRITIDGVEYEVADNTLASAITNALSRRDSALVGKDGEIVTIKADAQKAVDTATAKFDQMKVDHDKLKERNDALDVPTLVKARVALVNTASKHLDKETVAKLDGMSDRDVKVAVIKSKSEKFDAEGKSDDYIAARYDGIIESDVNPTSKSKLDDTLSDLERSRQDGKEPTLEQIRVDNMRTSENAWQTPLGGNKVANGGN